MSNTKPTHHVATSPHLQDKSFTTRRMMVDVLIALLPVVAWSIYMYRQYAVQQILVCVATGCLTELLFATARGKKFSLTDGSAAVTGIILAMSFPWSTPIHVAMIASAVAIAIGKMVFGGVGMNLFNPAMVGRAFVMLAFASALGSAGYIGDGGKTVEDPAKAMPWLAAQNALPQQYAVATKDKAGKVEAVSAATPMSAWKSRQAAAVKGKTAGFVTTEHSLFVGNHIGSLGEVSAIACLLGGLFLLIRRTAAWQIPLGVLVGAGLIGGILQVMDPSSPWTVGHVLCSGAMLFGAFFIATDPVSSPLTPKGRFIFGLGLGLLIMMIRKLSGYPEGVMFAVLLMNAVVPLINRWTIPAPFGAEKKA